MLWAVQDNSELALFGRNGTKVVLSVPKGKFVVFKGDLGHAGAAYTRANIRVHCYVSMKGKKQRLRDKAAPDLGTKTPWR